MLDCVKINPERWPTHVDDAINRYIFRLQPSTDHRRRDTPSANELNSLTTPVNSPNDAKLPKSLPLLGRWFGILVPVGGRRGLGVFRVVEQGD